MDQITPEILVSLLQALKDSNVRVRAQAAQSLGQLGQATPEVVEALLQALQDSDGDVRAQATESLGQLGQTIPKNISPSSQALQIPPSIADVERHREVTQAEEQQVDGTPAQQERIEIAVRALADTPSKVDSLGYSVYAEALADFIVNDKTQKPLSIVIDAAWGMGKTTLMDMIKTKLEIRGGEG